MKSREFVDSKLTKCPVFPFVGAADNTPKPDCLRPAGAEPLLEIPVAADSRSRINPQVKHLAGVVPDILQSAPKKPAETLNGNVTRLIGQ